MVSCAHLASVCIVTWDINRDVRLITEHSVLDAWVLQNVGEGRDAIAQSQVIVLGLQNAPDTLTQPGANADWVCSLLLNRVDVKAFSSLLQLSRR